LIYLFCFFSFSPLMVFILSLSSSARSHYSFIVFWIINLSAAPADVILLIIGSVLIDLTLYRSPLFLCPSFSLSCWIFGWQPLNQSFHLPLSSRLFSQYLLLCFQLLLHFCASSLSNLRSFLRSSSTAFSDPILLLLLISPIAHAKKIVSPPFDSPLNF